MKKTLLGFTIFLLSACGDDLPYLSNSLLSLIPSGQTQASDVSNSKKSLKQVYLEDLKKEFDPHQFPKKTSERKLHYDFLFKTIHSAPDSFEDYFIFFQNSLTDLDIFLLYSEAFFSHSNSPLQFLISRGIPFSDEMKYHLNLELSLAQMEPVFPFVNFQEVGFWKMSLLWGSSVSPNEIERFLSVFPPKIQNLLRRDYILFKQGSEYHKEKTGYLILWNKSSRERQ